MKHDYKLLEKIANDVQNGIGINGLSSGVYLDFAVGVAVAYYEKMIGAPTIEEAKEWLVENKWLGLSMDGNTSQIMTEFAAQVNKNRVSHALNAQAETVEELAKMQEVVELLVKLKDLKDEHGKTDFYLEQQPIAWQKARALLPQMEE